MTVRTIGCEGVTGEAFVTALAAAEVRRVIDVCALPLSSGCRLQRRPETSSSRIPRLRSAEP